MSTTTPKNQVSVSKILTKDVIWIAPKLNQKEKILEFMVQNICSARRIGDPKELLQKIMEREKSINTTLDTGLSIPHARIEGINEIVGGFALFPDAIPDPSQSAIPIRAILLFFVPIAQEWSSRHLLLLRNVATIFQNDFLAQLSSAKNPQEVVARIRGKENAI